MGYIPEVTSTTAELNLDSSSNVEHFDGIDGCFTTIFKTIFPHLFSFPFVHHSHLS